MANYVNLTKKTFNPYNPKVLNEGQFSWMTQDTGQQIGSERENTIDVWMFDNQGNSWYEKRYEGYGEFGGMDYYELLARMNGYSEEDLGKGQEMRNLGIDLAFDKIKTKDKGKKVLFPALVSNPKFNWKRHDFTQEADSDPNQSWYQEPEYEDDYYESIVHEDWGSSDQNIMNKAIHKDAGSPKKMPSPFDSKLRAAAEDAVDFYWDDWEEYQTDRDGLIDNAVRGYLRSYFRKDWDLMVRMFEPMESVQITEAKFVKDFDKAVLDATTEDDVLKVYPDAEFFVGKMTHFFGQLEPNLFFKAYYTKGKDFEIASIYSEKGSRYVDLWKNKAYESEELKEAWWGTYEGTPEGKKVDKKLDKAFAKFKTAVSKAHAAFRGEIKGLSNSDLGSKSGFNDSEGGIAVADYLQDFVKSEFMMSDFGQISRFDYMKGMYEGVTWDGLKESLGLNERSINKISKEHASTVLDMSKTVEEWKAAEGDRKTELLDKLKALTKQKKELEAELDSVVAGKDKDLELAISEAQKKTLSEGLESDLKKFIKNHRSELEEMADNDQWEDIHDMLYTEFDIKKDSRKAKDLIQTFEFMF